MATTRLMPLHTGKGRTVGTAIEAIIDYVANPEKTDSGRLITSWQCDSRVADREFLFSKQQYIRNTGRVRGADDVIAYHLRQSFRPGEITPEEAEYAQLLSEKKAMYADYQKAREDMRALQTAKANVDRILGDNSLTAERESEKDGR